MATYAAARVRRATRNSRTAAKRSAENRRCPLCGRKSALKWYADDYQCGFYCRWDDCKHDAVKQYPGDRRGS